MSNPDSGESSATGNLKQVDVKNQLIPLDVQENPNSESLPSLTETEDIESEALSDIKYPVSWRQRLLKCCYTILALLVCFVLVTVIAMGVMMSNLTEGKDQT